jgi:hypothetical protein
MFMLRTLLTLRRFIPNALIASLFLISSSSLLAKKYGYHDGVPFRIGYGFDPAHPSEPYRRCISHDGEERIDGNGSFQSSIVLRSIKSREDLFRELGVSVELAAHAFFASGKANVSYFDQMDFFEDGLSWAVIGKVNYGRVGLKNVELLPKFQKMLDDSKYDDFAAACGTHYLAEETRGATVFAVYTLHNLSQVQKTKIESLLQAGASLPFAGASIESEFRNVVKEASRSSQVDFRTFALGGAGLVQLSSLATDADDIRKVQQTIREYLKTMTVENAVPISYMSASMKQFGFREASSLDLEKRDQVLAQHYLIASEGRHIANRLFATIGRLGSLENQATQTRAAQYKQMYESLLRDLELLYAEANRCYADARQCVFPTMTLPYVRWPAETHIEPSRTDLIGMPSRILDTTRPGSVPSRKMTSDSICEERRVSSLRSGQINEREYIELKTMRAMPLFSPVLGLSSVQFCD